MPPFSFKSHRPRFLRSLTSLRSRSPNLSPADPRKDAPPLDLDPSHASFSRAPPTLCVPEQRANTDIPGTSYSPASGNHQTSTREVPDNFGGKLSPASSTGTSKDIVPSSTSRIVTPHVSDTEQSTPRASPSNHTDSFQAAHSLVPSPTPYVLTTLSQCSLEFQRPIEPSSQYSPQLQRRNQGMFNEAHDFTVTGTFIDVGNVTVNTSNKFMEKLLKETIPGAQYDSSDRDPPPRCLPGTRLAILERCLSFIRNCDGQRKIRWVVGAAGVGKSAVMQSVAECPELPVGCHASVFFSINGRNDGTKTMMTISYQFAAKSEPYCLLIEKVITRDPSLLRASMAKQLLKLIAEPFIHNAQLNSGGRVLVIIDGLDECKNPHTQQELLRLITDLCITHPSSPLVWLIASRPEAHITSFFSRADVIPAYEKEEIPVNSDEARTDIERFLRTKLTEIRDAYSLDPHWPEERHFWILANASGGLFAYAQTVVNYIGDLTVGSPSSQLSDVLHVIENHPMSNISPEEHPMALLDALYARILSNVPPRIMANTRKILLALALHWDQDPETKGNFSFLGNLLGMTPDEAYAAVNHLRSVLYVPRREEAYREYLQAFHKSFIDFICDFIRSGFSRDIKHEAQQLINECASRVLIAAPDGVDFGVVDYETPHGCLVQGPGKGDNVSLTWPFHEGVGWVDNRTKLYLYKMAIRGIVIGVKRRDQTFQSEFCIRLLATRFRSYDINFFPYYELRDFVFDESRRHEFSNDGILKLMPAKDIDISRIIHDITLRFRRSATIPTNVSDPWNLSCEHMRAGVWEEGKEQDWTTKFESTGNYFPSCPGCFQRLEHQWKSRSTGSSDYAVLVLFTSAGQHCVEFQFVDPEDGMSEWTYCFWVKLGTGNGETGGKETKDKKVEDEDDDEV